LHCATTPRPLALLVRSLLALLVRPFIGTSLLEFKYCQQGGCEIQAHFGSEEDKVRWFCKEHKDGDHILIGNKRCEQEGYESQPVYGSREDGIARLCIKHKEMHHVNVVSKLCRHEGCEYLPAYGSKDDGEVLFCAAQAR
jgi:hypothetical protein